jgi:uncharacterized protein with PIN domain
VNLVEVAGFVGNILDATVVCGRSKTVEIGNVTENINVKTGVNMKECPECKHELEFVTDVDRLKKFHEVNGKKIGHLMECTNCKRTYGVKIT